MNFIYFLIIFYQITHIASQTTIIDANGYIAYCPCMGRFGNQADHFLGALGFSKGINRTLILPPWVEYRYREVKSIQIPFDTYFKVEPLEKFHKVITMEKFMENASHLWPTNKRIAFCYMSRGNNDCNAKEGNPFGPFWDTFDVNFIGSTFYNPLHYDTHNSDMATQWNIKYPPERYPVLAFTGAPASFPVQIENRALHEHLQWSDLIENKANDFIKNKMPQGAFIAIHLRNGMDWVRACEHIPESPNLFSAPQCLGYRNEKGKATLEMCLPSKHTIIKQLKRQIKKMDALGLKVRSIFVSSDRNHMEDDLREALKRFDSVDVATSDQNDPHVSLAIMAKSNHFIGNCISSFSAFVKRERDAKGFPSSFWGFPVEKKAKGAKGISKDEL